MYGLEKFCTQRTKRLYLVRSVHHNGDVVRATAVRNHVYWRILQCVEHLTCVAFALRHQIAYYTYNYLIFIYFYCAEFLQIVHNVVQVAGVVNGDRYANL